MKKLVGLLLILLVIVFAEDRVIADPTALAIGSRYEAIGGTGVSFANNSQAIFINPALIKKQDRNNLSLYFNKYFDELNYLSLSSVFTINKKTLGIGFVSNTLDGIPKTVIHRSGDEFRIYAKDEYSVSDKVFLATYAIAKDHFLFLRDLNLGTNFKLANQQIDSSSATGFGFDFGTTFKLGGFLRAWQFGAAFKNFIAPALSQSSAEQGAADKSKYQSKTIFGASNTFALYQRDLLAAVEIDSVEGLHMGLEYSLTDMFKVRTGINAGSLTYGFGLQMYSDQEHPARSSIINLDYCYHQYDAPLENLHMFTISFFGAPPLEKPIIEYPKNRFVTTADRITVAGKADTGLDVSVFVNGKLRSIGKADKDRDWIVKNVYLDNGRNTITVKAGIGDSVIDGAQEILVLSDRTLPEITQSTIKRNGQQVVFTAKVSKRVRNVYVKTPGDETVMLKYNEQDELWQGNWQIKENFINQRLTFDIYALDFTNKKSNPETKSLSIKVISYPKDKMILSGKDTIEIRGKAGIFTKSLIVGDKEIIPSEDGSIKSEIKLDKFGKNLVEFNLVTSGDNKVKIPMRILRVVSPADLEPFGRENQQVVDILTLGYMQTDEDNKFNANRTVTKAEFAEILAAIKKISAQDVVNRGYLSGDLSEIINKAQVIEAIVKMEELLSEEIPDVMPFTDVSNTAPYYNFVAIAYSAGILQIADRFNANSPMKRIEIAGLIANSPTVVEQVKKLYNWTEGYGDAFKDITEEASPTVNVE